MALPTSFRHNVQNTYGSVLALVILAGVNLRPFLAGLPDNQADTEMGRAAISLLTLLP